MPSLMVLRGLPGCGKTTFAKTLVKEQDWLRFNRDSLRECLSFGEFKRWREDMAVYLMRQGIVEALIRDYSVVVDSIHLNPEHIKIVYDCLSIATLNRYELGQSEKIYFEVKEFPIDIDECIENDGKRKRGHGHVGEKVIRKLYDQWIIEGKYSAIDFIRGGSI